MSLLDPTKTYELTMGDVYNINLCGADSQGEQFKNLLYNALKDVEVIKYPSDFEERVKSLLIAHYEHLRIDMNISIQRDQHPIWPEQEVIMIFINNMSALTYYLDPKTT